MEIFLNELSVYKRMFDNYDNIVALAESYKELSRYNIKTCYLSSNDYVTFINLLKDDPLKRNLLGFIYAFFHAPYEDNDDVNNDEIYISHSWTYDGKKCFGLALSYIFDSLSLSINPEIWHENLMLYRDDSLLQVRNIASPKHVEYHKNWIDSLTKVELVKHNLPWGKNRIHLREDHGYDVLMRFSEKIIYSPYVLKVIDSLEFHQHCKKFIYKVKSSGIIELVLYWTDPGYGIAVQTTGRNLRETEEIAKILREEFEE